MRSPSSASSVDIMAETLFSSHCPNGHHILDGLGAEMMINTKQQDTQELLALIGSRHYYYYITCCSELVDVLKRIHHQVHQRLLRLSSNLP